MTSSGKAACENTEQILPYALGLLPPSEHAAIERHLPSCAVCRLELDAARRVVERLAGWPTDVLRPSPLLWDRLASRIATEGHADSAPAEIPQWREPEWKEVAPGISCKLLAMNHDSGRVSMLVRLAPGVAYPPHTHASVEELHLLQGELWIEDRKLLPGDYNRGEPGATDIRVYSETGCTCVLITSLDDALH